MLKKYLIQANIKVVVFKNILWYIPCLYSGFYLLYAKLEEEHGLARHAMGVYDRATKAVLPQEQNEVFLLWIIVILVISVQYFSLLPL